MNKKENLFSWKDVSKYRNVLMGLGILLILFFHFAEDCKNYNIHYNSIISFYYNYIHSSGVDLFLFLSGFGLYYSWKKNPDTKYFYEKRFLRILLPYFIVAIPAWCWYDFFFTKGSLARFLKDLFFASFFTSDTRWYWFILMIFICYLIFPFCFRMIEEVQDKSGEQIRIINLCVFTILLTIILELYDHELYSNTAIALDRFPLFFIGILAGKEAYSDRTTPRRNLYLWLIVIILAVGPLKLFNIKVIGMILIALLNLCLCFMLIIFLNFLGQNRNHFLSLTYSVINHVLGWFGSFTLELYLIHVTVRRIMNCYGFYTCRLSCFAFEVIVSIVFSLLLKMIVSYINKGIDHLITKNPEERRDKVY